ncbi:MAG: twin-arginine translocase subunit TatC [Bacteroidales bacterium]|nr:twin-arginine translocase subunit TatC [Bacteroidales bacterium]MBN2762069.1 twin-arginine translocase subunit TatC [Bacteroidales bacterium]
MTFLEHLEELRWHLIRSAVAIVVIAVLAFMYKHIVFDLIILGPSRADFLTNRLLCRLGVALDIPKLCLNTRPMVLQSIEMAGQFTTHIKISVIAGLVIASPYVFYEFWKFVRPALYSKERRAARGAVLAVSFLFFTGVLFGYYVICPLTVNFLFNYRVSDMAQNNIKLMSYVSTITGIGMAAGVVFELPAVVYFLTRIGLVTPDFLKKFRKHAIVAILLLAAIITPSPDVFSQLLVAFPLFFLYEISILISRRTYQKESADLAG